MKDKQKQKAVSKAIILIFIVIIVLIFFGAIFLYKNSQDERTITRNIFAELENIEANLTEYIVYGTHLNLKGDVYDDISNIKDVNLILTNQDGEDEKIKLKYEEKDGGVTFSTSDLINTGIDLEEIGTGKYFMLIEVKYGEMNTKPVTKKYAICNKTEYDEILYYTLTKNHSNNKIDIKFNVYETEEKSINYMFMDIKAAKLPKDVYDIVIDPGHGGGDKGAEGSGYKEADLTLKYSKKIKEELEKLGLKVRITRDGTENEETFGVYTVYDEDGRVNIVGNSKAKYVFSIHLNSITEKNSLSGVEIYAPPKTDLKLAKAFADNIVKYGKTTYSDLEATYRKYDGVYVRTFKEWEIEDAINDAKKSGYTPYNITEETPYLYMLRETGGIATSAYVDGRNKSYGTNKYYNSNIGVESYLIELGYINHRTNLKNLIDNEDGYVKGVVETIKESIFS